MTSIISIILFFIGYSVVLAKIAYQKGKEARIWEEMHEKADKICNDLKKLHKNK